VPLNYTVQLLFTEKLVFSTYFSTFIVSRKLIIIIIIITEMYDCTSNNWSHWNSNEKLKEKSGSCARKTLDRSTTKDSYTWNITHNTESTAM